MKTTLSPRIVLAALLLGFSPSIHAQTLDWGAWDETGSAVYGNGDTISISGLVNGSVIAAAGDSSSPHLITDPAFPYANAPGAGEYGFFRNTAATTNAWSVKIDLANFMLDADSVIGFSNLDGRDNVSLQRTNASILFLDSLGNPVSVSSATFVGSFDNNWSGLDWTNTSTFDRSTGVWDVIADSGTYPAGSYFGGVANAFFLTNLPTSIASIIYTKNGPTNHVYDSTLFYAGTTNVVPEPSSFLLTGLAGAVVLLRRSRKSA